MVDLRFSVDGADAAAHTVSPTVVFRLRIENAGREPVRSIMLGAQIRIAAAERPYSETEQERLVELFGQPVRWADTLHDLLWAQTSLVVPTFSGATTVAVPLSCSYDVDVASAKYFDALVDGTVPLIFLFSGTVFLVDGYGLLQAMQIPWDREARFSLPVAIWRNAMDAVFPNSAWLRVHRDVFERLNEYRSRLGLLTWEATLENLLGGEETHIERA